MYSEFYNVALDRIRYSLVWEDSTTLNRGLETGPDDRVLVITSAGCNVLNTLLKGPKRVVAVDLNPVQNELLRLKRHMILHHEHAVLRSLMGFDGPQSVAQAWQQMAGTLPAAMRRYWNPFFENHPEGILTSGRLETYLTGFLKTLSPEVREKLQALVGFEDAAAQRDFFLTQLHDGPFRTHFLDYFNNENLSKGRDPKLFTYARESGGQIFYNRLLRQISLTPVKDNFFFRFLFFGPAGLPEHILPPCYRKENFATLRGQLHKLQIVEGEAVDYLLSAEGAEINKASLSNIFEYTSQEQFADVCNRLLFTSERKLRFIFWNLLQEQGAALPAEGWNNVKLSGMPLPPEGCFYLTNARLMENFPVLLEVHS